MESKRATGALVVRGTLVTALTILCISGIGCLKPQPLPRHPQAAAAMDRLLSNDSMLQSEAEVELRTLGRGAMPELQDRFSTASAEQRKIITEIVATIGEPREVLIDVFTKAARDPDPSVRRVVAFRSAAFPQLQRELAPSLQLLIWDTSPEVQAAAIASLSGFSADYTIPASELRSLMRSRSPLVVAAAVTAALPRSEQTLQNGALEALSTLVGEIMNPSPLIRAAVIIAIGKYGTAAEPAVPPLVGSLENDPLPEIRLQAALALARIKTTPALAAALPALQDFANNPNPTLAGPAQQMLLRVTPARPSPRGDAPHP